MCGNHPQGIILVKYKDQKDAGKCIELMNGRWFVLSTLKFLIYTSDLMLTVDMHFYLCNLMMKYCLVKNDDFPHGLQDLLGDSRNNTLVHS